MLKHPWHVGRTGLEPVTSALSKQRSEPTELTSRGVKCKTILFYFIFLLVTEIFVSNLNWRVTLYFSLSIQLNILLG